MKINKKGFTLIEVLVVVLIIGVLAAVALPSYRKVVEKSKATQAVSILNDAAKAEQDFALASSRYTKYWDDLVITHPNMVEGTVYCLQGENTDNQDDCGSDSTYKVKLTVGNTPDTSVVMATRMPNDAYGDYKLFKYMNGDPNIYCKAATTSQTNICEILGFQTRNLPETRNIDRQESINCATELHGGLSNPSNYTCDRITYDDGSFDENAYFPNGDLFNLFNFDSEGKQMTDIAYYESGEVVAALYSNGNITGLNSIFPLGEGETMHGFSMSPFNESGQRQDTVIYYSDGAPGVYDHYVNGVRQYRAMYNQDGTLQEFRCFKASCGGSGTCVGAACSGSNYAEHIPPSSVVPTYDTYVTEQYIESMCAISTDIIVCH